MSTRGGRRVHLTQSRILGAVFCILLIMLGELALAHVGEHGEEMPDASPSSFKETGLQAASWVLTLPYGAAKVAYAIGGGVVGGLAWAMTAGNMEVGKSVWIPSMTGDYIVQPQHLTGYKPLRFLGVRSEEPFS